LVGKTSVYLCYAFNPIPLISFVLYSFFWVIPGRFHLTYEDVTARGFLNFGR